MSYNPDSALGRLEKTQRMRPTTDAVDPADAIRHTYSRQVQRQRERLAAKGRDDTPPAWMLATTARRGVRSKYLPHESLGVPMTSPDTGRAGEVRKLSEKQIQSAVLDRWRKLGLPHTRVAAIPNAGAFGQPGLTKGVPDLLIIAPGLPIGLLELKTDKGKLSPEQEAFKSDCIIAGVEIAVTYGLDEAINILEHWRVVRKV